MAERYERVRVGWHCAKVKGHAELKIENPRVKTSIVTISPNYIVPTQAVSVLTSIYAILFTVKVIERSRDVRHTKVKV